MAIKNLTPALKLIKYKGQYILRQSHGGRYRTYNVGSKNFTTLKRAKEYINQWERKTRARDKR